MPWVRQADMDRLERDLAVALERAVVAESRLAAERERLDGLLAAERQSKDWLTVQLASRVVTKHGGYGLDHEPKAQEQPKGRPDGFVREPTELDLIRLAQYEKWAAEAGIANPNEDARARWEAEMRGEMIYSPDEPM